MPMIPMHLLDGTQVLRGDFADLTLSVALDGFNPEPPALADVVGGTFGDISLDGLNGVIERRESELQVRLGPVPIGNLLVHAGHLLNKPVRLRLADGREVLAELGHHAGTSTSVDVASRTRTDIVNIQLDHWRYGIEPTAWVAKLDGVELKQGNLLVGSGSPDAPRRWGGRNLRLLGSYTWHVIRTHSGYSAVIEGGVPLNATSFHADLTALEFTLGLRLRLGVLVGVDAAAKPVSAAAPVMSGDRPPTRDPLPPVPPWMERQCWMPRFFAAVAHALSGPDATRFYVAINTYLDSLSDSLDSSYLRLQVALEAFCRYGDPPLPLLVCDEVSWRAWVEARREEIVQQATDARAAQRLLDKIRSSPKQRPSSDAVRAAFASWELDVPEDELAELDGRNIAAHRYLMNESEDGRDLERDVDRTTILRTLLLAAVAREAGYRGPIHGWAGMRFGQPRWWQVIEEVAVAQRWYACLRADR